MINIDDLEPIWSDAIYLLHPNKSGYMFTQPAIGVEVTEELYNEGYREITGVDGQQNAIISTNPSDFSVKYADAKAKYEELVKNYKSQAYARSRKSEYPDWGTQLDYIYHNGLEKWKTDIVDPVKAKYPKPS